MGGLRTKREHGLGKIQKNQRSNTDWKVYEYLAWCNDKKKESWFNLIKSHLQIDSSVLRKSLNRLMKSNQVQEYGLVSWSKDKLGRKHATFYKGYRVNSLS